VALCILIDSIFNHIKWVPIFNKTFSNSEPPFFLASPLHGNRSKQLLFLARKYLMVPLYSNFVSQECWITRSRLLFSPGVRSPLSKSPFFAHRSHRSVVPSLTMILDGIGDLDFIDDPKCEIMCELDNRRDWET
jgi:hypothetical protein